MDKTDPLDAVLTHHGIKGMKWGFRKAGTGKPSSHKKGEAPKSEDAASAHDKKTQAKTKGVHTLSNADLKKLNERLNLEQNYARMTQDKGKLEKGHNAVKAALALTATAASVYAMANSPMVKAGRIFLKAQFEEAIDAAIPNGKGAHRLVKDLVEVAGPKHRA